MCQTRARHVILRGSRELPRRMIVSTDLRQFRLEASANGSVHTRIARSPTTQVIFLVSAVRSAASKQTWPNSWLLKKTFFFCRFVFLWCWGPALHPNKNAFQVSRNRARDYTRLGPRENTAPTCNTFRDSLLLPSAGQGKHWRGQSFPKWGKGQRSLMTRKWVRMLNMSSFVLLFFLFFFVMCHKYLNCSLGFGFGIYSVYLQFTAFTTHLIKTGSNLEMDHIVCVRAQNIFERHVSSNDEHLPITKGSSWKCLLVITGKLLMGPHYLVHSLYVQVLQQ